MHLFRLNDSNTRHCNFDDAMFACNLRLFLVGVLGSFISTISIIENFILFYVFSTSRKLRRQNYVNPVLLAFFDILVSIGYLLISPVHLIAYRLNSVEMVLIWARFMPILYCVEHFALTVCNFLLVIASLERYLAIGSSKAQQGLLIFVVQNKPYVIVSILTFAFLLKATLYLEISIFELPQCAAINSLVPVWLIDTSSVWQALRFWTRMVVTVVLPFLVLVYFNYYIVKQLHKRHRRMESIMVDSAGFNVQELNQNKYCNGKTSTITLIPSAQNLDTIRQSNLFRHQTNNLLSAKRQSRKHIRKEVYSSLATHNQRRLSDNGGIRAATRTLVMVVGCYLISNSLVTVLHIWEFFDVEFLRNQHYYAYVIASDLALLLTICGCALRLPIYIANDKRIRKALFRAMIRFRYCLCSSRPNAHNDDEQFLDKWSIVVVSNSLRSNITGFLGQLDLNGCKGKRSFDQLAILVQDRRRFLVQMTINLGAIREITERNKCITNDYGEIESPNNGIGGNRGEFTILTNIQEEESEQNSIDL